MPTIIVKRLKQFYRALALISDTHVGSMFGLFPEEYELKHAEDDAANIIRANAGQLAILKHWKYFMGEVCDENGVDTVIHLGDAVEGENPKGKGAGLILNRLDNQKEAFRQLIRPYIKGRQFFIVSGSHYHESESVDVHQAIANELKNGDRLHSRYAGVIRNLIVDVNGTEKTLNIGHAMGCAENAATTISNEGLSLALAEAVASYPRVHIVARGHIHRYMHTDNGYTHGVVVPSWKAFDPFFKGNLLRSGLKQGVIGGVLLLFDKEGRVTVEHYIMRGVPKLTQKMWRV